MFFWDLLEKIRNGVVSTHEVLEDRLWVAQGTSNFIIVYRNYLTSHRLLLLKELVYLGKKEEKGKKYILPDVAKFELIRINIKELLE